MCSASSPLRARVRRRGTRRAGRPHGVPAQPSGLIEQVLVTQQKNFVKHSFFWRHVTAVFGHGLITSEGDAWLAQRRMIQPAFHRERITGYGRVMVDYTERMLDGWRDGSRGTPRSRRASRRSWTRCWAAARRASRTCRGSPTPSGSSPSPRASIRRPTRSGARRWPTARSAASTCRRGPRSSSCPG